MNKTRKEYYSEINNKSQQKNQSVLFFIITFVLLLFITFQVVYIVNIKDNNIPIVKGSTIAPN